MDDNVEKAALEEQRRLKKVSTGLTPEHPLGERNVLRQKAIAQH